MTSTSALLSLLVASTAARTSVAKEIFYVESRSGSETSVLGEKDAFLAAIRDPISQDFDSFDNVFQGDVIEEATESNNEVLPLKFDGFLDASLHSAEADDRLQALQLGGQDFNAYMFHGKLSVDFSRPVEAFGVRAYLLGPLSVERTEFTVYAADGSQTSFAMAHGDDEADTEQVATADFFLGVAEHSQPIVGIEMSNPASLGTAIRSIFVGLQETTELCSQGHLSKDGNFCCSKSCGGCGGCGCASMAGGADECCPSTILESAVPCIASSDTGCVMTSAKHEDRRLDEHNVFWDEDVEKVASAYKARVEGQMREEEAECP